MGEAIRVDYDVALFGSVARGASDESSDLDVICVLGSIDGVDLAAIRERIGSVIGAVPSVSFYSRLRISQLYREGGPFAWHLFLESRPIEGFSIDYLESLGRPASYLTAAQDVRRLSDVLLSVEERVRGSKASLCYEAGLIYVCLRNIGIFSSFILAERAAFDRYAPFALLKEWRLGMDFSWYQELVRCRHASARGGRPILVDRDWLICVVEEAVSWSGKILERVDGK